jgi:hypothetical protein
LRYGAEKDAARPTARRHTAANYAYLFAETRRPERANNDAMRVLSPSITSCPIALYELIEELISLKANVILAQGIICPTMFRREQLQGASTHMKAKYVQLACMLVLASGALAMRGVPLLATPAEYASLPARNLYAVNQSSKNRGSISIYDIDAGHRLIKTIHTVPDVGDVRGVAISAVTNKLYVAYRNNAGVGMIYCVNVNNETVLWNKAIYPGVDRLAINPNGQLLYVPTGEEGTANYINVVDANTGDIVRRVYFSNRSHDTLYPLSGPIFQEMRWSRLSGQIFRVDKWSLCRG